MNIIYRVRDNEENKYIDIDSSDFMISQYGALMQRIDGEYVNSKLANDRYSIEWGIEIDGKKFYSKDVIYWNNAPHFLDFVNNKFTLCRGEQCYKEAFTLNEDEELKIVGTIHDEEFKYLKEYV